MRQLIQAIFLLYTPFLVQAQSTEIHYLTGLDKDRTVDWEFSVSGGRNSGEWKSIPTPSNWEMQGFGTYRYWSDWGDEPAPDSVGNYRYRFDIPADWKHKTIDIVFGGSMTDTEVRVNGKLAGPVHQGGFYEFRYAITDLLKYGGQNLLEVEVRRFSSNQSVNLAERRADFWLFSGIYRPVWLEVSPESHIRRMALDARHNGEITVDVFLEGINSRNYAITAQIQELNGRLVGSPFSTDLERGQEKATLQTTAENIKTWSAEWPNRYQLYLQLKHDGGSVHETTEKFGFRTIEVRERDGVYINDAKIRLRGTNRHSFWPTSGRTTSRELSVVDVNLIKDMNMNAVRMSHYPPDKHFLEVADSLGLYVMNELTGWQDEYDAEVGENLVRELVIRDVNHPSVIFWNNGNEGGWNVELDDDFARWDPQNRVVLHPWDNFNGINTTHYEVYDCCAGSFFHGDDLFMPTEFLHGLYDGGNGAGLEDWWNLMIKNPLAVGGFLWAFADEGIVRDDKDGMVDVAGNSAPDGIVGPYREKEGSFYAIKEIWSPVYIEFNEADMLPPTFDDRLKVENRYDHTNLNDIRFSWKLADLPNPTSGASGHIAVDSGNIVSPDVPPHRNGGLHINLPESWSEYDVFYITATDPHGREIYTWSWMIHRPEDSRNQIAVAGEGVVTAREANGVLVLEAGGITVSIDTATGKLRGAVKEGIKIPFSDGPVIIAGEARLTGFSHWQEENAYVVEALYEGNLKKVKWTLTAGGWLKLDYNYRFDGHDKKPYLGVSFSYPEDKVTGMRWLGRGPYRVWKNRLKGMEFNVWQKDYNDAITGIDWDYPEFKGFHGDVYWAVLENKEAPVTIIFSSKGMFLRVFTPKEPQGERFDPRTTRVAFPEGDISFLRGVTPIGTKFHAASQHGPAGGLNLVLRHGMIIEDTVWFYFGK